MERSEDNQVAFTWRQFYSEDQDIPEQLNFFAMVKVSFRFSDIHYTWVNNHVHVINAKTEIIDLIWWKPRNIPVSLKLRIPLYGTRTAAMEK